MSPHELPAAPWWRTRPALLRFVADLVAAELAALRHDPLLLPDGWTGALSLEHDLGMDSLELLHVGGRLSSALQMHRSGIEDYLLTRRTLGDWVDIATTALEHWSGELTFSTSGSTGQPKHCSHALDALEQEAQALAALFAGRTRLLVAVPSHHIYGFLLTQLLPRHLGLAPGQVVSIRSRLPAQLALHAEPGDLVIGYPQFWQAAVAAGHRFPADVTGLSSTAPCPDQVSEAAAACGLAALFQLYGSSETAGLGWRASHRDHYRLLPYLACDSEQHDIVLRTLPDGRVEALQPQDALDWRSATTFSVGPRRDGAVQVGGVNVFPAMVRAALLEHPEVADAAVRLMRPDEGVRLKVYIVPRAGSGDPALAARLRAWMGARLAPPERPKALTLGTHLPQGAMGKPADWNIR